MRATQAVPEKVYNDVTITMTAMEASILRDLIGDYTCGNGGVHDDIYQTLNKMDLPDNNVVKFKLMNHLIQLNKM